VLEVQVLPRQPTQWRKDLKDKVSVKELVNRIVNGTLEFTREEIQLYVNNSKEIEDRLVEIYEAVE
jgi:hypothetical protein